MNTLSILREILENKFGIKSEQYDERERFAILGIDSVRIANFILELEDQFDIEIDFDKVKLIDVDTPYKLAGLIESLKKTK